MKSQKNKKSSVNDTRNADAFALASGAARHRDDPELKQFPDKSFDKEAKKINNYKNYFV